VCPVTHDQSPATTPSTGLTTAEHEELRALCRENWVLKEERNILKKAAASSTGRRNPTNNFLSLSRWDHAQRLYAVQKLNAQFKLYPGVAHNVTPAMARDVEAFLASAMTKNSAARVDGIE
jgi:hypothetical protein